MFFFKTGNDIDVSRLHVSQHPQVMHRLERRSSAKSVSRRPTHEDMRDMKYMRAVINVISFLSRLRYACWSHMQKNASACIHLCEWVSVHHLCFTILRVVQPLQHEVGSTDALVFWNATMSLKDKPWRSSVACCQRRGPIFVPGNTLVWYSSFDPNVYSWDTCRVIYWSSYHRRKIYGARWYEIFWILKHLNTNVVQLLNLILIGFLDDRLQKYLTPTHSFSSFQCWSRICLVTGKHLCDMLRDWLSQSKFAYMRCHFSFSLLQNFRRFTRFEGANPSTDGMGQWTWTEVCNKLFSRRTSHICSGESLWCQHQSTYLLTCP